MGHLGHRLGHLPESVCEQRITFATATILHSLADRHRSLREGLAHPEDTPLFTEVLVDVVVGMFDAAMSQTVRSASAGDARHRTRR